MTGLSSRYVSMTCVAFELAARNNKRLGWGIAIFLMRLQIVIAKRQEDTACIGRQVDRRDTVLEMSQLTCLAEASNR